MVPPRVLVDGVGRVARPPDVLHPYRLLWPMAPLPWPLVRVPVREVFFPVPLFHQPARVYEVLELECRRPFLRVRLPRRVALLRLAVVVVLVLDRVEPVPGDLEVFPDPVELPPPL